MPNSRQRRLQRSKRRVQTLVGQGVPFNPAGASQVAIDQAVQNTRKVNTSGVRSATEAAGQIAARAQGVAKAPKGGPTTFSSGKRRYR